ncbi:hypothetical protein ACV36Q_31105, partial [Pseudomonas aeruginosa]
LAPVARPFKILHALTKIFIPALFSALPFRKARLYENMVSKFISPRRRYLTWVKVSARDIVRKISRGQSLLISKSEVARYVDKRKYWGAGRGN